jgi:ribosomal protein S1
MISDDLKNVDQDEQRDLDEFENAILSNTDRLVQSYKRGDIVDVRTVKVDKDCLLVDIGRKSEVFVPIEEIVHDPNLDLGAQFKVGDLIPVKVVRDEYSKGGIFLSHKKALYQLNIDNIEQAYKDKQKVKAVVHEKVKGGLIVDIDGVQAFLPGSLVSVKRQNDLSKYIGQTLDVQVIEFEKDRRKVVVSHKIIEQEHNKISRNEFVSGLEVNTILDGVVSNIVDYGVFVDIGFNVEGLVHISELAWGATKKPSDVVKKNEKIKVRVIGISDDRSRISLSLKRTLPDPWEIKGTNYHLGQVVEGKVVKDLNFGALIEIEEGINSFMHISQMSHRRINTIGEIFQLGDTVRGEIVELDISQKRMKISRKNIIPPEDEITPDDENSSERTELQAKSDDLSNYVDVFVPKGSN